MAKPTVLCLHGMFSSGECFQPLIRPLQGVFGDTINFTCPTLPFHNTPINEKPDEQLGSFGISDAVDYVSREWVDLIEGPIIIIGVSLGGLIAEITATRRKERIERIILINPAPQFSVQGFSWSAFSNYLPIITTKNWSKQAIRRTPKQTIKAIGHNLPPDIQQMLVSGSRWSSGKMLSQLIRKDQSTIVQRIPCGVEVNMMYCGEDRLVVPRVAKIIASELHVKADFFPHLPHYPLHDNQIVESIRTILNNHVLDAKEKKWQH